MLNESQFLPGMEALREADPHEQTEAQFHNRPNMFVHGRFERPDKPGVSGQLDLGLGTQITGFHAGTERAAHDRLGPEGHAVPWKGTHAVFYHGVVDPEKMRNKPEPGHWEGNPLVGDKGRIEDKDEDWNQGHHDKYYRNDWEDKGSTSVILSTPIHPRTGHPAPTNFLTHRAAVSEALRDGKHVPSHVRAVYDATGGAQGSHAVSHTHFKPVQDYHGTYGTADRELPGMDRYWAGDQAKYGPNPASPFVPLPGEPGHDDSHDFGGYGKPPF
jgi:hypothetical protein